MICEKCKEQNLKSRVYGGDSGMSTLAYNMPYYDEEGRYHCHDTNTTSYDYECSNGHKFTVHTGTTPCYVNGCDWNDNLKPEKISYWKEKE